MEYLYVQSFLEGPELVPKTSWTEQMKRFWLDLVLANYVEALPKGRADAARHLLEYVTDVRINGDMSGLARLRVHVPTLAWIDMLSIGPFLLERVGADDFLYSQYRTPSRSQKYFVIDHFNGLLWDDLGYSARDHKHAIKRVDSVRGWSFPTYAQACSLAPRSPFPESGARRYPGDLFDSYADVLLVRDEKILAVEFDSAGCPVPLYELAHGRRAVVRLVMDVGAAHGLHDL
jgi:hypothetical protein